MMVKGKKWGRYDEIFKTMHSQKKQEWEQILKANDQNTETVLPMEQYSDNICKLFPEAFSTPMPTPGETRREKLKFLVDLLFRWEEKVERREAMMDFLERLCDRHRR